MGFGDRNADSAGFPWAGRTFQHHDTEYANDDGSIPAPFADAITKLRAEGLRAPEGDALARVVASLSDERLLVPLVAEAGETGVTPEGKVVDKSQELSIPTVAGPDGAAILPVFSNADAMRDWNPKARPVPASVQRVVVAALEDEAQRVVIDGGQETEFVLTAPMLRSLATGAAWIPAYQRQEVVQAIATAAASLTAVAALAIVPGDPHSRLQGPELQIVLVTQDAEAARRGLETFVDALGSAEAIRAHAASLNVSLYPMGDQGLDVQFPPGSRVARLS